MGIFLKEEHLLADVSSMMSSELRRHRTNISLFICFRDVFPQISVQTIPERTRTDTLHSDRILFFTERAIKHNHKPTATPTLIVKAAADNHSIPSF